MTELPGKVFEIKSYLTENGFPGSFDSAVVLGSGLGDFSTKIEHSESIAYKNISGFPKTSVQGHSGELFFGTLAGKKILSFSGRFHHYEGYPFSTTVLPVQLAKAFNAKTLIISNAAGAINTGFQVGDLMVIDDIFRLFQKITPFPVPRHRYNLYPVAEKVRKIAASISLEVQRGTYVYVNGPNYETKAEIRMFRTLGCDVVGMSTVPELIEASRLGIDTAAISLVTNMATGLSSGKLDHSEVEMAAESRKDDFAKLVTELIRQL